MRRTRTAALAAALLLMSACSDDRSPTVPDVSASPSLAIAADLAPSGPSGVPGFRFGPPIVHEPLDAAAADASLLDLLAVEICKWPDSACSESVVRRLTQDGSGPARLHVDGEGVYHVVWQSRADGASPGDVYRVRVLASGAELGHVDVEASRGSRGSGSDPDGPVRITAGSALPIAFVVEEGVGMRAGSAGGTVVLANGLVTLNVPPGAVPADVFFTAVPMTNPPIGGKAWVPGTAWDFGPDGIEFAAPVVMTIHYDPADVPSGVDESELRIHKLVDGELKQQNAGLVDLVNHSASAEVNGFSVYVVVPRDPDNPKDVLPPEIRSIQFLDPASGTFESAVTLDAGSADADLTTRLTLTDDGAGVASMHVEWESPSGRQLRVLCYRGGPPESGVDTNGEWLCTTTFAQHAEAGLWRPHFIRVTDKINNEVDYTPRAEGFCDLTGTNCLTDLPSITIESSVQDLTPPVVTSLGVSLDVLPRSFASSIDLDAAGVRARSSWASRHPTT